jgi:SAM-dependent methyltransferase
MSDEAVITLDGYTERVVPGGTVYEAHASRYYRAARTIPSGAQVLDAGSGAGFGAATLASDGRRVTGSDLAPEVVARAQAEFPEASFVVADVLALPFPDESFDAVTCFEVIEHVEVPRQLVRELARVLRPGGLLCVSTPHARMERLHAERAGRGPNPFHISPLLPVQLRRLLAERFEQVRLFGQAEDRGLRHAVLQSLDPLGLRLRLAPERRAAVRRSLGSRPAPSAVAFRFSRLLAHSAATTYVEARKR